MLTRLVKDLLPRTDAASPEERLGIALDRLVTILLGESVSDLPPSFREFLDATGPLSAHKVGELYEYLRGFSLSMARAWPVLIPTPLDKRNQGLFYTPRSIVTHIVEGTLNALGPLTLSQLLALKVLDPAMGTGLFLAEVLEQLTSRILGTRTGNPRLFSEWLESVQEELPELLASEDTDDGTLVRCHVLRNCLYGVDLDPIAVRIARAAVRERAFGITRGAPAEDPFSRSEDRSYTPDPGTKAMGLLIEAVMGEYEDFAPNLRVGNSLVGEGFGPGSQSRMFRSDADIVHARLYLGPKADPSSFPDWVLRKRPFHWSMEFPEAFSGSVPGFDAVVGNPPYEILSVRESGLEERRRDQAYFRKTLSTCHGKINLYRLMLERSLELLRNGGALGYIVPATLLADSTAEKLRTRLLESSCITEVTIIPEKAKVFPGVTQAFLILVTVKGSRTHGIKPAFWDGSGPIPRHGGIEITRDLLVEPGMRVPLVRSQEEKALLKALMSHAPLGGNREFPPVARVNQGEVNLTTHKRFVTDNPTEFPLIRGEHVTPFRVVHPSPRGGRLDWVDPAYFDECIRAGTPWKTERIVVGRVVNMDTQRRLKAAPVPEGSLLGDMTNSLTELAVPMDYLLGLLNSSLLNWRMRLTSTNNYISAAEIQALPIPRPSRDLSTAFPKFGRTSSGQELTTETQRHREEINDPLRSLREKIFSDLQGSPVAVLKNRSPYLPNGLPRQPRLPEELDRVLSDRELSTEQFLSITGEILKPLDTDTYACSLGLMVETLTKTALLGDSRTVQGLQGRLDAVVAMLYGVESYLGVFAGDR